MTELEKNEGNCNQADSSAENKAKVYVQIMKEIY